jgi:hypothetical protein
MVGIRATVGATRPYRSHTADRIRAFALLWQVKPQQGNPEIIWIDPYYRTRFGAVEYVTGHWRRLPA